MFWRCLAIHQRIMKGKKRPEEDTNREALKLARDFYRKPNLKREDVKPTRLVDFENIAKQFKVNLRLFEPVEKMIKRFGKLVFGKINSKRICRVLISGCLFTKTTTQKQAEKDNRDSRQGHWFLYKRY